MLFKNPYFDGDDVLDMPLEVPFPSVDVQTPLTLISRCPDHTPTPLVDARNLAREKGVSSLFLKDETGRMNLGSFKALGAAYVIAHEADQAAPIDVEQALKGRVFVTASAGNHGLSVAAGAQIFGAKSVIYLAETVPAGFADRLREKGAEVRVEGVDYEASMAAAANAADREGFTLLSDSSWDGYTALPHRLMEGYLVSAHEIVEQMPNPPTHVFLQAGVGGLAGAMAAYFRERWHDSPVIVVVEPTYAPALQASIDAGKSVFAPGPVSNMGRLDCKEPSLIALKGLARDSNFFLTIDDDLASETTKRLADEGIHSTPSGVAGLAGFLAGCHFPELEIDQDSQILCIISEGADA
ncbi:MAG: pyridoxal-phosphate dependent enzyme [Pseudomonadota bacterium]